MNELEALQAELTAIVDRIAAAKTASEKEVLDRQFVERVEHLKARIAALSQQPAKKETPKSA